MAVSAFSRKVSRSTSQDTPKPERIRRRFPKAVRLRQSRDFSRVREFGKSSQGRLLKVGFHSTGKSEPAKVGIITSRRVGGAVDRNRVRRLIREIVRPCLPFLQQGILVVVVAKNGSGNVTLDELKAEWLLLTQRLSILPNLP